MAFVSHLIEPLCSVDICNFLLQTQSVWRRENNWLQALLKGTTSWCLMMVGISLPTTFHSQRHDCTHTMVKTFDIEKVLTFFQCFSVGLVSMPDDPGHQRQPNSPSRYKTLPEQLHWHQESTAGGPIAALPSTLKEQQHIQTLLWTESCPLNQKLQNHCVWTDFKRLSLRCATRGVKMNQCRMWRQQQKRTWRTNEGHL